MFLVAGLLLALLPGRPAAAQAGRESLETLLERARAQRERVLRALEGQVGGLVRQLDELPEGAPASASEALTEALVRLGPEATPLLVAYLDPGSTAEEAQQRRAGQVAAALTRLDSSAITTELLRVLSAGSNQGKANALRVLETSSDAARVRPALILCFQGAESALKESCLEALIRLGGAEVESLLGQVLSGSDRELAAMALAAVTRTRSADAAEHVRGRLAEPEFVVAYGRELLAYFVALPEAVRDEDLRAFIAAAQGNAPLETRVALVEALPLFKPGLSPEFRRSMEPLLGSPESRLREAALVVMSRLGDKGARKDLLRPYDELVQSSETWSQAYARRAEIHLRIGDVDEAIDDYKKALQLGVRDPTVQPDTHVGLARAYARKGRLKEAFEVLQRAPISIARLQELALDPDFRELRDSKYGKQAFGLK